MRASLAYWAGVVALCGCQAAVTQFGPTGGGGAGGAGSGGIGGFSAGSGGSDDPCLCLPGPHNDLVYLVSDDAEIWSYNPLDNDLKYVRSLLCTGVDNPYSMAIDHRGQAWVLSADTDLIFTFDLAEKQGCEVAEYTPKQVNFDLFGMAFVRDTGDNSCPEMFIHSYSGEGPFSEGSDSGSLGQIDQGGSVKLLSSIDYDGGELAGTGDGRLFALAGTGPAKLISYDPKSGETLATTPLNGYSKTNASAFAVYAGDFYLFSEALPPSCLECLQSSCGASYQACQADPMCADQLACALSSGDINDECGGGMPQELQQCVANTCSTCLLPSSVKTSQVTKYDPQANTLEVVLPDMPIRVVGAGESVCIPPTPN